MSCQQRGIVTSRLLVLNLHKQAFQGSEKQAATLCIFLCDVKLVHTKKNKGKKPPLMSCDAEPTCQVENQRIRSRLTNQSHPCHLDVGDAGIDVWGGREGGVIRIAVTSHQMRKDCLLDNFSLKTHWLRFFLLDPIRNHILFAAPRLKPARQLNEKSFPVSRFFIPPDAIRNLSQN